ncbi:hypothetical protein EDC04DRAFT_2887686 [Pisolithus marmoratus]|nr:hypothetical protein EDC04DRAFT_2887686 [Pisolithus marmoratus]
MYYTSWVKPDINSKESNISNLHIEIDKKFQTEPQETQDEVMCIHKEQSSDSKNVAMVEDDEKAYLSRFLFSNIQQCTPALQDIFTHLSQQTGWSFSILMGGLDPTNPEEKSVVASLHFGRNKQGLNFGQSYPPIDETMLEIYGQFLDSKYHKSLFAKEKIYLHILGSSTEVGATSAPSVSDQEDKAVDANNAGSMGNEDNGNGDDNDDDDDNEGEDPNDKCGDCEDGGGQQGDGSRCVDKLSDQQAHLYILSPSVCSAAGVATTHTVAPDNPTAATFPSVATLLHAAALGNPSVATLPNIATPPCAAVPNFPVNPSIAMPTHIAHSSSTTILPNTTASPNSAVSDGMLFPPQAIIPYHNVPISGDQLPDFSNQLLQELGSFGTDFDLMLARTATWSTSQWSGSGQVSSQIPALSTIADMDTPANYLSGRAYYDYQNAALRLPLIPSIVPSPQSNSDLPLLLSAPSASPQKSPPAGHGKCKPVLSLHAQRDNMIGEIGKENSLLTLVGKKPKKSKTKHSAEDNANGFPVKRPKNKKTATEWLLLSIQACISL